MRLRDAGITSARQIAPQVGMSVRTIERWLAAGGDPNTTALRFTTIPSCRSRTIFFDVGTTDVTMVDSFCPR
ncbi:hypothetical protein N184_25765 [Sinorhizobium sp. GL28]|nr:hypothetical protein N184_25765 [Sinorhizobium sp. GL28]